MIYPLMETLRSDEHDLGSVTHLHRAQARCIRENFACNRWEVRDQHRNGNSKQVPIQAGKGLGFDAFADEPLATGEDVGERLKEKLQLRGGGGCRDLHRNCSAGELHVDSDGGVALYKQENLKLSVCIVFQITCE